MQRQSAHDAPMAARGLPADIPVAELTSPLANQPLTPQIGFVSQDAFALGNGCIRAMKISAHHNNDYAPERRGRVYSLRTRIAAGPAGREAGQDARPTKAVGFRPHYARGVVGQAPL